MKKLLLIISLLFCAGYSFGQQLAANAGTTLHAYRNFQDDQMVSYIAGPVTFSSAKPSDVHLIADQTDLGRIYAGEYVNYKWYALITTPGTQSGVEGLAEVDLLTGERKLIATSNESKHLTDMTYDYTTGTMYGIASSAEKLATINLKTSAVSLIETFKDLKENPVYALTLACDLNGSLYMISTSDTLYQVNKKNALCTPIGYTGADAAFTQTMAFDHNTHTLYWTNNADYTLYTVDITTGKATSLGSIGAGGGDSMGSLFIPYIHVASGAPDRVTKRKTESFENRIVISWEYPAIDAQGNPLIELTKASIYRDNTLIQTLPLTKANIGSPASYADEGVSKGVHTYRIVCENSKGIGGKDDEDISGCAGENTPGTVQNFTVTCGDNVALLSWEAPTEGSFGGVYNPNDLKGYVIQRIGTNGTQEIAINDPTTTSYSDETGFGKFSYTITAINSVGTGITVSSPEILIKPAGWIIMSNEEYTVAEGKFYDTGGPNGYYKNSERLTMTLKPSLPNAAITAEFTEFSVDTYGDTLFIYDGLNTSARLIGKYSASSLPTDLKRVIATNNTGALTFHFYSDVAFPAAGWSANISCFQKKEYDLAISKIEGTLFPSQNVESEYTVTFQNLGINPVEGSAYKVQLIDKSNKVIAQADGVTIASMETKKVILKLIATDSGLLEVKGHLSYAEDNDPSNNSSEAITLNVQEAGSTYVSIGENEPSLAVLPASFYSLESLGEILYSASQIQVKGGMLQMISFPMKAEMSYDQLNIKVWVAETELTNLNDGNIFAQDMTQVFSGNCPITTGDTEWIIPLSTSFKYSGKNLLILVQKGGESTDNMGIMFCGTYGDYEGDKYSCFTSSETPIDPNVSMGEYSTSSMLPDVKLLFTQTGTDISPCKSDNIIRIYPNPFTDNIYIESNASIANITLNDISGTIVLQSSDTSINTSNLGAGIYILKIYTGDNTCTIKKIIKQ